MENKEQKQKKLKEIKSLLAELEEGFLLNHPSFPKIWKRIHEIDECIENRD